MKHLALLALALLSGCATVGEVCYSKEENVRLKQAFAEDNREIARLDFELRRKRTSIEGLKGYCS